MAGAPQGSREAGPARVPVAELVDLAALERADGRPPGPARLRAALPRGWVLEPDGVHARRDLRLLFREGWILLLGLVAFGSAGLAFLFGAMPRGARGALRFLVLLAVMALLGGLVAPVITRALQRRRP